MSAGDGSTAAQRTHRYLRLSLALIVVALLVAVASQVIVTGRPPLLSISHYFYTPAGGVFTACLVAVALALLALSGRDAESTFLNVAAVFAPLIAIIPTGYETDAADPERVCPADTPCVPEEFLPTVRTGVVVYIVMVVIIATVALVLRRIQRQRAAGTLIPVVLALVVAVSIGLFAFVAPLNEGFPFNDALPLDLHYAVTIAFFAAFAVVPAINAWPREREAGEAPVRPWHRAVYTAAPIALAVDLVLMLVLTPVWPGAVFWGESGALVVFAAFWVVQTIQRWNEPDPRSLRATG
ncbi:hypothetical protein [Microbacterium caowuchunii]|uniref:DUF998 domain-containing protein n=1 Tax=Microbacterium caowuchunii TaxID=2614638 RepID=A0A5N0TM28_9MICO|nr:hypothetical protein [Microbacterium caowuchunii]KAA9135217.1 hypothetical protein F6B40_05980 [Microbacterium caowuchunii]